jgi:predicted DNA binding protein
MLIAEYWTDTELLKGALERAPEMTITEEEQYQVGETAKFLFWAEGGDFEAFEEGLDADPTVAKMKRVADLENQRLYRTTFSEQGYQATTFEIWAKYDIVLLNLEGTVRGWTVRMRFPDKEAFDQNRRAILDRDRPFDLLTLYDEVSDDTLEPGVTEQQARAMITACQDGYFEVPRKTSQACLADKLDISSQALSERLRRGMETLIETRLLETGLYSDVDAVAHCTSSTTL